MIVRSFKHNNFGALYSPPEGTGYGASDKDTCAMAQLDDFKVEMYAANLYREELITDRKMGVIHVLTPVTAAGTTDLNRTPIYTGEVQIMTQMGPLPISFEIKAANLEEAVKLYGDAAKQGVKDTIEKMQQMRREAASKIVTPGTPGFGVPPAPGATGGSGLVMP